MTRGYTIECVIIHLMSRLDLKFCFVLEFNEPASVKVCIVGIICVVQIEMLDETMLY